jgi:Argonaute siRNA chaperone (ARC) complex subunit Arb1
LKLLPGAFNSAARVLYCDKKENELGAFDNYIEDPNQQSLDKPTARAIFGVTFVMLVETQFCEMFVTDTYEQTFEVTDIQFVDEKRRVMYKSVNDSRPGSPTIEPCGILSLRPTVVLDGWDNPMTDEISDGVPKEDRLYLEEGILRLLKAGMKLTLTVCTLNIGVSFIKHVKDISPTFYTFLPQELMLNYKEPVMNKRPASSVHDPYADEDILSKIPIGDPED